MTPLKIIISSGAGPGDNTKAAERLAEIFKEDQTAVDISLAQGCDEITELAREAARGPHEVIVAAGGDGTINTVAAAVLDTDKILGVLPLGTLNHFAKDLSIPIELERAARTIIACHTADVVVSVVFVRVFFNSFCLGLFLMIFR